MFLDGDLPVGDGKLGQRRLHSKDSVTGQGRLDGLGVGAFGQQELPVVLSVYRLCVGLLFVLGVDLKWINTNKYTILRHQFLCR